jgi:hypothetical protein
MLPLFFHALSVILTVERSLHFQLRRDNGVLQRALRIAPSLLGVYWLSGPDPNLRFSKQQAKFHSRWPFMARKPCKSKSAPRF